RFCSGAAEIMNGCQNIFVEWRLLVRVGCARAGRLAKAAEIEGNGSKARSGQGGGLFGPTLLFELAAVGEHNATAALAINVGENQSSVLGLQTHVRLRGGERGDDDKNQRTTWLR